LAKMVKQLPASESGAGVRCKTRAGAEYIVSQCPEKMRFTLWEVMEQGLEPLGTAKSPLELYEKIPWEDK